MHAIRLGTVNPFAVRMLVEVHRDGGIWSIAFERGELAEPLRRIGNTADHGTSITFHPDPQIFGHATFNAIELREALRAIASCVPGLQVRFVDERTGRSDDFHDPRGPTALVEHLGRERPPLCETIRVCGERDGIRAVIAFRYYAIRNSQQRLYVNARAVTRNRRMLDSYMPVFHYALSAHARAHGLYVPTGANLNAGLVAVLSLWHPNPEFFDDCEYYGHVEDFEPSSLVVSTLHNELRTFWPARPDLARRLLSDLA
jgi:DNA gyrase subunit B